MLIGPIYPFLIKYLWKYAFVNITNYIQYSILRFPFIITPSSIDDAIGCAQKGVTTKQPNLMHTLAKKLLSIYHNTSDYETTKPKYLIPQVKDWFSFLLTNLKLRGDNHDIMFHNDKLMIFCLLNRVNINSPQTIFNHLKESNLISRRLKKSFIPYGKILFEPISKADLVEFFWRIKVGPESAIFLIKVVILSRTIYCLNIVALVSCCSVCILLYFLIKFLCVFLSNLLCLIKV